MTRRLRVLPHARPGGKGEDTRQLVPGVGKITPWPLLAGCRPHWMPAATSTQHFPLLQAQIPFSRFIFTESLKYDWGDVTAVFSRSRRYHSPERAPKIKYFMSKNMKISPRKDPRLPPSWTLLGEAPKSDKKRGLHFLCKKGEKKLQYFGLTRQKKGGKHETWLGRDGRHDRGAPQQGSPERDGRENGKEKRERRNGRNTEK